MQAFDDPSSDRCRYCGLPSQSCACGDLKAANDAK